MQRTLVLLRECGGRATFAILAAVIAVVHANDEPRPNDSIDGVLQQHGIGPDHLGSDASSWNSLAHDLAFAEDQFLTFKDSGRSP